MFTFLSHLQFKFVIKFVTQQINYKTSIDNFLQWTWDWSNYTTNLCNIWDKKADLTCWSSWQSIFKQIVINTSLCDLAIICLTIDKSSFFSFRRNLWAIWTNNIWFSAKLRIWPFLVTIFTEFQIKSYLKYIKACLNSSSTKPWQSVPGFDLSFHRFPQFLLIFRVFYKF